MPRKKTNLYIALALISILVIVVFIVPVALGLLSTFWLIAPVLVIGVMATITLIYYKKPNIKTKTSELTLTPTTAETHTNQNEITPNNNISLPTSPQIASNVVISQTTSSFNQPPAPEKPVFPKSKPIQSPGPLLYLVPILTQELVFSSNNQTKATWVSQHVKINFLEHHEFIFNDHLRHFLPEVRIADTAKQNSQEYEIGIRVFKPTKSYLINNMPAAEKAIKQMKQEYGSEVVELIGIIGEKKGIQHLAYHEEITISQTGIDRIIEIEWQKIKFEQHVRDIFECQKYRFSDEEFNFLMINPRIKSCLPRGSDSHFYELYSVTVDKDSENEWSTWLGYIKNTLDTSFSWSTSGPNSLYLDTKTNPPNVTLKLMIKCEVIKDLLIKEASNPFTIGQILQ